MNKNIVSTAENYGPLQYVPANCKFLSQHFAIFSLCTERVANQEKAPLVPREELKASKKDYLTSLVCYENLLSLI